MTKGTVRFFSEKGYGFVQSAENETKEDFFYHVKNVKYDPVMIGDQVTFEVVKSKTKPGKLEAVNVQIAL